MRAAALVLLVAACQGESSTLVERASKHTATDRGDAMAALAAGLDEAFAWLNAHPGDTTGALARARPQIARFYTNEETAAFALFSDAGNLLLYIPTTAHHPTVWLGRTQNHLIPEPAGLTPAMRDKTGL